MRTALGRGNHSDQGLKHMRVNFLPIGYIKTSKGTEFVKGKRSTINPSVNIKKDCTRLNAMTTTLTERRDAHSPTGQASVFCRFGP